MGIQGVYAFLTAAVLLCADPVSGGGSQSVASSVEPMLDRNELEIVASSPLPAGQDVGSHYGWRTSARTGRRTFHAGSDFLVERGTPVYAVRGGVVELVTTNTPGRSRYAGYGNAVVIHHPDLEQWTFYAHLDSVDVEEGQPVRPGQPIGAVGSTNNGRFRYMVPHLHLEVRRARADGSSPFPGRYRRYNLDPEQWLTAQGVRLSLDEADHSSCDGEPEGPLLVVRERGEDEVVTVADNALGTARF